MSAADQSNFFHDLMATREFRRMIFRCLLQSAPAVVVAVSVVTMVVAGRKMSESKTTEAYVLAAQKAYDDSNWKTADLYYRKIAYLTEFKDSANHGLALTAQQQGNVGRARSLMERIAPLKGSGGYAPAHFWLARDYYEQLPSIAKTGDSQQLKRILNTIEKHLLFTVDKQKRAVDAHALLGQVYLTTGQRQYAADHFAKAVSARPQLRLLLASLYRSLNQPELADRQANAALEYYKNQLESEENNAAALLNLGAAHLFLNQFVQAEKVLLRGLAQTKEKKFRMALAMLCVHWYERTENSEVGRRLDLLQRAFSYAPNNTAVLERLMQFATLKGELADDAKRLLEEALIKGDAPATVHLLLGTLATHDGDQKTAVFHLEQAYRAHLKMPAMVNNLAWALAHSDPPQLERALALINSAVELTPAHPQIRDTRGNIFLKMNRWKDAVTDLEIALKTHPNKASLHASLAKAYKQLGQPDLAAKHERLASEPASPKPES